MRKREIAAEGSSRAAGTRARCAALVAGLAWLALLAAACSGSPAGSGGDAGMDAVATDGAGAGDGAVLTEAGLRPDSSTPPDDGGADDDAGPDSGPCGAGALVESHGVCVPLLPCATDGDCVDDTRCVPAVGCVPWEGQAPAFAATCVNPSAPGLLTPAVRCELSAAPAGDPFPAHVDVLSTPTVVNFNQPGDSGPPSIIATFTATVPGNYTEDLGVIRVLRGTDCSVEANLGGEDLDGDGAVDWIVASASVAVGDLDGDGVAEIVAFGADGATLAFTRVGGVWMLLWKAPYPAGAPWTPCDTTSHRCSLGWTAPAIHDLDDDGAPEVIREGVVFSAAGALRSLQPAGYVSYSMGLFPVVANLDQDPAIELTNGQYVWEWSSSAWVLEPGFVGGPGHVALADFGAFGTGLPAGSPELALVTSGSVSVRAVTGELAMTNITLPGSSGGGPPTIADFDGDGLPEIGVAGRGYYTVFDLDCGPSPRPGGVCPAGTCDFAAGGACPAQGSIAWSRVSQDYSSNVTGSVAFDFDGDGASEIVYADECFTRIFDGRTGEVLASHYRSSCTFYESPIVADVDGDFRAELVIPSNKACAPAGHDSLACTMLDANGVDILFAGARCAGNEDCASQLCDQGRCRCTTTADCCAAGNDAACLEQGTKCAPPPAGTPGSGNTCRAGHPHGASGIRVLASAGDRWVRARPVWNQPTYSVTNVNEDGTVPRSSAWTASWSDPATNGYRANVSGRQNPLVTGDLTAGPSRQVSCSAAGAAVSAPVCNRGAETIGAGIAVGFYAAGVRVCGAQTAQALAPGACVQVGCTWSAPPTQASLAVDLDVVPNDAGAYRECQAGNNHGTVLGVFCAP